MRAYTTPGIYVDEKQVLPPSIAQVSTAIPAFIGYVAKADGDKEHLNTPIRINTIEEYVELFGTVTEADQQFSVVLQDDQGDGNFDISSVTAPTPETTMYYNLKFYFDNGGGACYVVPVSRDSGTAAVDRFKAALASLATESEPTLIVVVQNDLDAPAYHSMVDAVLAQCQAEQDRFGIFDLVVSDDTLSPKEQADEFRAAITSNKDQLKYGAVYYPSLRTRYGYEFDTRYVQVVKGTDDPVSLDDVIISNDLRNRIIQQLQSARQVMPPGAAIAGVYAKTDRDRGVWKSPANISLSNVSGPVVKVTNEQNGELNVDPETGKSVNVIRDFGSQGILVWGARTLAGNDNEWRYVPVRRLFNFIEESIKVSTTYAVFEPNDAMLWLKIKASATGFLTELWRQGALAGAATSDAFFVEVGLGKTMTPQDILEGRCIVKIGIAAVRPAEFIILEFTHKLQQ